MNIDITRQEHEELEKHFPKKEFIFGSKLYGTDGPDSDTDILRIIQEPGHWRSFINSYPNIHQLKYTDKENKIDYIYTTSNQFLRNQRSGDSIINSELIMFSPAINYTERERLERVRTYKVLKAFLGFAKRDIRNGKFWHADRCLSIVDKILFRNELPDLVGDIRQSYDLFKDADKLPKQSEERRKKLEYLKEHQKALRNSLNLKFEKDEIKMYFVPEVGDSILQKILDSNNTKEFRYD